MHWSSAVIEAATPAAEGDFITAAPCIDIWIINNFYIIVLRIWIPHHYMQYKINKEKYSAYHSWWLSTNADMGDTWTVYVSFAEYSKSP